MASIRDIILSAFRVQLKAKTADVDRTNMFLHFVQENIK